MKFKKVVYCIILFILAAFVLSAYNSFNGNLISKFAAKKALEKYLTINYPNEIIRITNKGSYDFKFNSYDFKVINIKDSDKKETSDAPKEYEFSVRGFINLSVVGDPIRLENIDEDLMKRLGEEAAHEIKGVLIKEVPEINSIDVHVEVLKGQLESGVTWRKDLKFDKPMTLFVVTDALNVSKEQFLNTAKKIQKLLNLNNYTYSKVNINGNIINNASNIKDQSGYVKFSVKFDSTEEIKAKDVSNLEK